MLFIIRPHLEARAEIQKYFRWFFGSDEKFRISYEINWPLLQSQKKTKMQQQIVRLRPTTAVRSLKIMQQIPMTISKPKTVLNQKKWMIMIVK